MRLRKISLAEYVFICTGEILSVAFMNKEHKKGRLIILKVVLLHLWRVSVKTTSQNMYIPLADFFIDKTAP